MKADKSKAVKPAESLLSWKLPARYLPLLFIPWSLWVLVKYFNIFPMRADYFFGMLDEFSRSHVIHPYMLKALMGLAVAAWLAWLAFQIGQWLLTTWLPNSGFLDLEWVVFSSALGLGALSFFTFLAGALHLWYPGVFWVVLGALSVLCLATGRIKLNNPTYSAGLKQNPMPLRADPQRIPWRSLWVGVLGLFLLLFLIGDLTPEIFYDALYYHIAVPNLYQLNHRLFAIPTLLFSNFVLTIQMLYGLALTVGNTLSAKLLHGWMGLLLAVAYLGFGRRYLSSGAGLLAGIIFMSLPLVGINVITTGCDVGGSFLQFVAGYALIIAFDRPEKRFWVVAGVLTGLAASWKYPAFPVIPIATLLLIWRRRWDEHQPWGVVVQDVMIFLVPALLVLAPTLIKNIVFHGNPLYPFGGTRFGTPKIDPHYWHIFISDANTRVLPNEFASLTAALHFLLHPWYLTFGGSDNGSFIGPMLLMLLPLLFLVRTPSQAFITLRRYVLLLWLLWLVSTQTVRYGLPALAMLAPLLAETIISACQSKLLRPYILSVVLVVAASNLYQLMFIIFNEGGWQVLGGLVAEDDYLSNTHSSYPTPPYSAIQWMNQNVPPSSKVLFVGEPRSFYIRIPAVVSAVPDPQPLVEFAKQSQNGADMAQKLRQSNITYLFLNYAEAVRTESYGLFLWDKSSWGVFQDFWAHQVKIIWKDEQSERGNPKAQYVYQLLSEKEASQPHEAPLNLFERWAPK